MRCAREEVGGIPPSVVRQGRIRGVRVYTLPNKGLPGKAYAAVVLPVLALGLNALSGFIAKCCISKGENK